MRRLLIIGCGDIGLRVARVLQGRRRIYALTRSERRHDLLRSVGVVPVAGDLDHPETLQRLAGIAQDVIHLAPPPAAGLRDSRTANLVWALTRARSLPQRLVYISTSGVYGDCAGAWVDETRAPRPSTDRARRRVDAERVLRAWGAETGVQVSIVRAPGIYAPGRLPLERLKSGTPALAPGQDPYTNHIHADDLARIVVATLARGRAGRAYNASDDSSMRMGDYFDLVAGRFGLPRPPRITLEQANSRVPATLLSFMRESRRLANGRMKKELRIKLQYPSVVQGVVAPANAG